MTNEWNNYPLGPVLWAIRTLVGRICIFTFALFIGSGLGGMTGSGHILGFFTGFVGTPFFAVGGLFISYGMLILPVCLFALIAYIRAEIKEWFLVVPVLLFWILSHDITHWGIHEREPTAAEKMQQEVSEAMKEAQEKAEKTNGESP